MKKFGATSYHVYMVMVVGDQIALEVDPDRNQTYFIAHPTVLAAGGLRVVYVRTARGIYLFLDECCNRTCHPSLMYERAKEIFEAQGTTIGKVEGYPE